MIIFNTINSTLVFLKKSEFEGINKLASETGKRDRYINALKSLGILVPDDIEEHRVFKYFENKIKFSNFLNFTILPTYDCNMRCIYCLQQGGFKPLYMTKRTIKLVTEFIKLQVESRYPRELRLTYYGGEPLLHYRAINEVTRPLQSLCEDMGVRFAMGIITNGTLLTERRIDEMLGYNLDFVQITLDGVREVHDKRRMFKSGGGTFNIILKNLKLLAYLAPHINLVIRCNVDRDNYQHIPAFLDLLNEEGLKRCGIDFGRVVPPLGCSGCLSFQHLFSEEEFARIFIRLVDECIKRGFPFNWKLRNGLIACGAVHYGMLVIDPEGKFYKCYDMLGKDEYSVGDVKGGVNYKYYDWVSRDPVDFAECRSRSILPLCGGGCPRLAFDEKGTIHANYCMRVKHYSKELLKKYVEQRYRNTIEKFSKTTQSVVDLSKVLW